MNCAIEVFIEEMCMVDCTEELTWQPYTGADAGRAGSPLELGFIAWGKGEGRSSVVVGRFADGCVKFHPLYVTHEKGVLCSFIDKVFVLYENCLFCREFSEEEQRERYWSGVAKKYELEPDRDPLELMVVDFIPKKEGGNGQGK